jgi:hypothetical protein
MALPIRMSHFVTVDWSNGVQIGDIAGDSANELVETTEAIVRQSISSG